MKNSGFTLLELSIVLLIASMLATFSVGIGKFFLEQNKIRATQIKLRTIASALDIYLIQHNKLPCPAGLKKSTGIPLGATPENSAGTCSSSNATEGVYVNNNVARGWVPYKELGLTADTVYDEWNNKIVYSVPTVLIHSNFNELDDDFNGITVYNDSKSKFSITNDNNKAIYTIVSHGKNSLGAFNKDGDQKSDIGISNDEKTNIASTSLSNSDEFVYFNDSRKPCYNDNTKKCDDLGRYMTKMQVTVDSDIREIDCDASQNKINEAISRFGGIGSCSITSSGTFLPYNASIDSTGGGDCNDKYKLICLKYGRLEVMQNDY